MDLLLKIKQFADDTSDSTGYFLTKDEAKLIAELIDPDALAYAQFPAMVIDSALRVKRDA
jgi:hypothetical protein